jgi:hypothetical protein
MRASESPVIRKATAGLLALTIVVSAVVVDGIVARYYFYSNWIRLENAAAVAATAGSAYLPADPAKAVKTAREYVALNGVRSDEILSTTVTPDDSTITIRLQRAMPFYLRGIGIGESSGPVTATTAAHASKTKLANPPQVQI